MGGTRKRLSARDRRQQIMAAATDLLARQGFSGTTTRQIAQRARVNEAIIFRHFPHKQDLYWAVISRECHPGRRDRALEEKLQNVQSAQELFLSIARDVLERNTQDTSLSRLLLFSALEHHRLSNRFFRTYVARYYETLADYIRERIRQGRLPPRRSPARGPRVSRHGVLPLLDSGAVWRQTLPEIRPPKGQCLAHRPLVEWRRLTERPSYDREAAAGREMRKG